MKPYIHCIARLLVMMILIHVTTLCLMDGLNKVAKTPSWVAIALVFAVAALYTFVICRYKFHVQITRNNLTKFTYQSGQHRRMK